MIRALWFLVLAALAGVAACAQLDRASAKQPELAALVPGPFRSFAQAPLTMVAMIAMPPDKARAEAMRLLRRRPVPADHLFLLAVADQAARDIPGYRTAFRRATERGWRVPPLQVAAAREAIANKDFAGAAYRVAALWAMNGVDPELAELTRAVIADPRGLDAFATQMARTSTWREGFEQAAPQVLGPAPAARAIAAANARRPD